MAVPIFRGTPSPDYTGKLIESLGTGLGQGLQSLAQQQLQNLGRRRQSFALEQLGIDPKLASLLPLLPPEFQKAAFQNLPDMINFRPEMAAQPSQVPSEEIQQGGASPQQIKGAMGKTFGDIFKPRDIRMKEEGLDIKKRQLAETTRQNIESRAAPYFKEIREHGHTASNVYNLAKEVKSAIGNVRPTDIGYGGKFTPAFLRSETGQYLEAKLNQLVLARAQEGKGVPSRMRLTLEQMAKPQIWQNRKTLDRLTDDILKDKELLRYITNDKALKNLQDKWGENVPRNFESEVNQTSKKLLKSKVGKKSLEGLPSVDQYHEGDILQNPETGQEVIKQNGKWQPIKG